MPGFPDDVSFQTGPPFGRIARVGSGFVQEERVAPGRVVGEHPEMESQGDSEEIDDGSG